MPINDLTQINTMTTVASQSQKNNPSEISMDDFLKILAASMSNPALSGGESSSGNQGTDYISQFVEFTSLQQLQTLGKSLDSTLKLQQQQQAFSLIGKVVTLDDNGQEVTGKVDKVKIIDGHPKLLIDQHEYPSESVKEVKNA
ncbi:flagellar basal body rod modification protein [Enterococcus cecorum]|uniref:flagellar basal body rod modification protein n=1 Tax=Enterococcus cecorum TaxID=44008 RepID=UPI0022D71A8E|nr:flagellar basal body rod modification protein [Enterococcus cecorum]